MTFLTQNWRMELPTHMGRPNQTNESIFKKHELFDHKGIRQLRSCCKLDEDGASDEYAYASGRALMVHARRTKVDSTMKNYPLPKEIG
jgi:hypothetical protein